LSDTRIRFRNLQAFSMKFVIFLNLIMAGNIVRRDAKLHQASKVEDVARPNYSKPWMKPRRIAQSATAEARAARHQIATDHHVQGVDGVLPEDQEVGQPTVEEVAAAADEKGSAPAWSGHVRVGADVAKEVGQPTVEEVAAATDEKGSAPAWLGHVRVGPGHVHVDAAKEVAKEKAAARATADKARSSTGSWNPSTGSWSFAKVATDDHVETPRTDMPDAGIAPAWLGHVRVGADVAKEVAADDHVETPEGAGSKPKSFKGDCSHTFIVSWFKDDCHDPKLKCAKYHKPKINDALAIWSWFNGMPTFWTNGNSDDKYKCLHAKGAHAGRRSDCASGEGERISLGSYTCS